jgi:hypothetical protein
VRLLVLIALLTAAGGSSAGMLEHLYFLDGVDRGDGMSARLSTDDMTLRITSDGMWLADCKDETLALCFSSPYMAFAYPKGACARWHAAGFEFERLGQIEQRPGVSISVIRSVQKAGAFIFFFNQQDGLVGWEFSYESPTGIARDRWFLPGFGELTWPQPNNSFKPKPLRGSA